MKGEDAVANPVTWARLEKPAVILIALHSFAVGVMLLLFPDWSVHFGGWPEAVYPQFFIRQGGAFHVVLAAVYMLDYSWNRSLRFMVVAKAAATLFLTASALYYRGPWVIPASAAGDAAMGLCAYFFYRRASTPNPRKSSRP